MSYVISKFDEKLGMDVYINKTGTKFVSFIGDAHKFATFDDACFWLDNPFFKGASVSSFKNKLASFRKNH